MVLRMARLTFRYETAPQPLFEDLSLDLPAGWLEKEITALYESLAGPRYTGHTGQVDNVLEAIESGTPLLIPARDGRATLELITAIYKSAMVNERVSLPLDPADEFYEPQGIPRRAPRYFKKTRSVAGFAVNKISFGNPDLNRGSSKG